LNKLILLSFIFILFQSCSEKNLTAKECEDISFNCYKGFPNSCNTLDNSCKKYEVHYTKDLCQKAFNSLVIGATKKTLEENFGNRITECFSDKEKENYLKD